MMSSLNQLPNLGPYTIRLLRQAGIDDAEHLRQIGAKQAFLLVQKVEPTVCIRVLYGLQGAINQVRDSELPKQVKEELILFFRNHKQ